jgi:alcohol dehydrogenase
VKAYLIDRYGGPDVVVLREQPEPTVGDHDLLVRVEAASVNPVDMKIRGGQIKTLVRDRFPLTLGSDLSGVVERVGAQVTRYRVGDDVFARLPKDRIGAFAERVAVDEQAVARKPRNLSHEEAASIPLVGLTAWQALVEIGKLSAGQRVLIHAGSGGLGTFAIQLAKHLGAEVATTVGARNVELARRLGATTIIDYKSERFEDRVRDYDLVFDSQGGDTLLRSFSVVRRGGKVVTVGGVPDATFARAWGLNPVIVLALRWMTRAITRTAKRTGVQFSYLFMRADGEQLASIAALLEAGTIKPVVDRSFPFSQALDAMAYVESGRAVGKVVIQKA